MKHTMTRTEAGEALRRLNHARTLYERHCEKHRKAEAQYREKIAYLEDHYEELAEKEANK